MAASYSVIADHDLLYVRYEGHHHTVQTDQLLSFYRRDPLIKPGLRCLLDCARLESAKVDVERRRAQMEALHRTFGLSKNPWTVVYYCPSQISQSLTSILQKMWEAHPEVDFCVARSVEETARKLDETPEFISSLIL